MKKAIIFGLGALLISSLAYAQIQTGVVLLNTTASPVGVTTGLDKSLSGTQKSYIGRIVGTRTAGAGTLDVVLQHSPVCGASANWKNLIVFTQQNAAGPTTEDVHVNHINTNVYPCVRAVATVGAGAGTTWNINVTLYQGER